MPPKSSRHKSSDNDAVENLRASLRIIALINGILDEAAMKLGSESTREMVLTLLILYKSPKGLKVTRLVEKYAAWCVERVTPDLEASVRDTLAQMRDDRLVDEKVSGPGENIRVSKLGIARAVAIRKVIDSKLDAVKSVLKRNSRKKFKSLIKANLPLPRVEEDSSSSSESPRAPKH